MKIRTDFVTNSSSSSFVFATIKTTDADLLNAMASTDDFDDVEVSDGVISINSDESDYGFVLERHSLNGVINCLLEMICELGDYEQYEILSQKKRALTASIEEFDIKCGETGDACESEYLCEEYCKKIARKTSRDYDEVWEEFLVSGECVECNIESSFVKGEKVKSTKTYVGPLD